MHLLVLGGTGATGRVLVEHTLAAGHSIRALVRSPDKLPDVDSRLEVVIGEATSQEDVKSALSDVDAVISTLGSNTGTVLTDATRAIVAGATANRVKRVVMLSSFAVLNDRLSFPAKLMARLAMSAMVRDKVAAEQVLRASDLDWMLVHAVRLANGPATGRSRVLPADTNIGLTTSISRADVATFLLDAATSGTFVRSEVVLGA
ncbi:MAG: NAD(P)H-binding protein [Candidatus Dormiibacterota bacterium]